MGINLALYPSQEQFNYGIATIYRISPYPVAKEIPRGREKT